MLVMIYLAVFSAVAICVGTLVVSLYEWRQDVLYGPYICRDHPCQKGKR